MASVTYQNRKLTKNCTTLGVINLDQMESWEKIKGVLNWVNVSVTESDQPPNKNHFTYGFNTKNPKDFATFNFFSR